MSSSPSDEIPVSGVAEELSRFIPLDFTYVVYDRDAHHSVVLAYLTFLPILVGIGVINAVLLRRDLEALYQATGLLLSSAINAVLKRIIGQSRPPGSHKLGYGMPSDHAQFSFFFVTYLSLWMVWRARLTPRQRAGYISALLLTAVIVCWSRIHLGVHSTAQVLVGSSIGMLLGALWAGWAQVCVWRHIFPLLEQSPLGRRWYFKDASSLPDGMQSAAEYEYHVYANRKLSSASAKEIEVSVPREEELKQGRKVR
jgi:dolichyldiphosphatase